MRKIFYSVLTAIAVVGGFTAAVRLHLFQVHQMSASPLPVAASPSHIPASPPLTAKQNTAVRPQAFQDGIDVDAYTYPKLDFPAAAAAVVAYVKQLHANSLSISFPFFMTDRQSSQVFATPKTPTPAQLGLFVADAERAGLYVSIRPLLSEFQIGGNRTRWKPADMSAWFASYQQFLLPYARMAEADKVGMFIIGAEFQQFGNSPLWNGLAQALAKVYHGRLAYSNNGAGELSASTGGPSTFKTVDAYPPISPPFLSGWEAYDRTLPTGTILTEVGIGAWDGAWHAPWQHRPRNQPFDPQVQARWFTAACQGAKATGLTGIYFWTLGLLQNLPPTPLHPGAWGHSVGADAIASCFSA
jgi:hypothetical protein